MQGNNSSYKGTVLECLVPEERLALQAYLADPRWELVRKVMGELRLSALARLESATEVNEMLRLQGEAAAIRRVSGLKEISKPGGRDATIAAARR